MLNTYGPTEATVSASLAELRPSVPVTIGTPLPNYGMLIIDPSMENGLQLLPRGAIGELCITGPGVAVGYLGRPDLTLEKFLTNPWAASADTERLYRTGDLAKIDRSGQIICLGRTDDQVKIRGFRVELGEIESVISTYSNVGTVAVVLRKDSGLEQLVAFIVPDVGEIFLEEGLRKSVSGALPSYWL
jgi:non-ribosomal peptide synthetase component F